VAYETIHVEHSEEGAIARVTLSRPEVRNAQNNQMTYELDSAFSTAALDDRVKVIVLAGDGPHFSGGHDLKRTGNDTFQSAPVFPYSWTLPGAEGPMNREQEVYFRMCRRWHDLPKPTIAEVHGKVIAGGLMLMWVCDLIVAAEGSEFIDITAGPQFMVQGVEWFNHPWELGVRKAKEMLFTGDPVTAEEALRLGMVNHVVRPDDLTTFSMALAGKIAARGSFGLQLAKQACNQALDAQGFWTAQQAAFNLQHLGHTHQRVLRLEAELGSVADGGAPPAG
jgi:enoyl-CoA hydratase